MKCSTAPKVSNRAWMATYIVAITLYAIGNVRINYLGKGAQWDIYPLAEALWVAASVAAVAACTSGRRLAILVIALMFLDSWVDACAMGNGCWWAGPPVLLGWKWDDLRAADRLYPLIYGYWILTWGLQVPARCLAMARMISGNFGRKFWVIALGLNLIWFTAPQDALFYFVWVGLYDRSVHYFDYLPPAGFWNLWNMLLLRVPLGVSAGALLVRAGLRDRRNWQTTALIALALVAIAAYAVICVRTFLDS